jgi:DNA-binding beta-propeller fold protein YncE
MRRFMMSFVATVAVGTMLATGVASSGPPVLSRLDGTVWVGDRVSPASGPELVGFDASSGEVRFAIDLDAPASDVAVGNGKVFVGEEALGQIAVIDARSGAILKRIPTSPLPHHLTASRNGGLIVYSAFGTNRLGMIDARRAKLVGEWPATTDPTNRTHAAALSPDGRRIYAASDPGIVSTLDARTGRLLREVSVPAAHELIVSPDGRWLYVSARSANLVHVIDLRSWSIIRSFPMSLPDTLQLARGGRVLTVGLRTPPARIAVVDLRTFAITEVTVGDAGTLVGHQWTSPNGGHTFVAFEGPGAGMAVIDHEDLAVTTIPFPGGGRPHGLDYSRDGAD